MTKAKRQPSTEKPPLPEPNERDAAAIVRARSRVQARASRIAVTLTAKSIGAPYNDAAGHYYRLLDAFGTKSCDFATVALSSMLDAMRPRDKPEPEPDAINAALALISGIEPENEVEALLATQMMATNALAMELLGRTRRAEYREQLETSGGLAVKLLRTFTLQAETLAKLRRGGGQTVRVEHVHVHAGGQAIVGSVTPGGGAGLINEEQPHAKRIASPSALPHADAPFDPLRGANPERDALPVRGNA